MSYAFHVDLGMSFPKSSKDKHNVEETSAGENLCRKIVPWIPRPICAESCLEQNILITTDKAEGSNTPDIPKIDADEIKRSIEELPPLRPIRVPHSAQYFRQISEERTRGFLEIYKELHTSQYELLPPLLSHGSCRITLCITAPRVSHGRTASDLCRIISEAIRDYETASSGTDCFNSPKTVDERVQTDADQVQSHDKYQQTDEIPSPMSREDKQNPNHTPHIVQSHDKFQQTEESGDKQQYSYSMDYPAMTSKAIGPEGGVIELLGYKVYYPPNSLKSETKIELSIDNNPCNFPKEGIPIASILNIKPSMKLEIPAIVTMPTSCKVAKGKVQVQIWSKERGEAWEKSQEVFLRDNNVLTFEVSHFTEFAPSVDRQQVNYSISNRLYIQKDSGIVLSLFWEDNKSMLDNVQRYKHHRYVEVLPTDMTLLGAIDKTFNITLKCTSPDNMAYTTTSGDQDTAVFKITEKFIKGKKPYGIYFMPKEKIPDSLACIIIQYSTTEETIMYPIKWPIEIEQENFHGMTTNITVDNSRNEENSRNTVAENIAKGGSIEKTAHGTNTNLSIKQE